MKLIFMGTAHFSVTVAKRIHQYHPIDLIVTQPSKLKGRKKVLIDPPLKVFAQEKGIPVLQPTRIKASVDDLLRHNPDMIVTAAYGQILPKALLEAPKYGAINVHASLLPKYRGGAPIQRAIENGEDYSGVSIMYMAQKMDAGDIIATKRVQLDDKETNSSLFKKLATVGADLLEEVMPNIIEGTIHPTKQNPDLVTFAPNIKREEEKLDFHQDAVTLERKVRAFTPEPATYFIVDNTPIKVYEVSIINPLDADQSKENGTVIAHEDEGVIIKVKNGAIRLDNVQPSGRKPMDGKSFLNGKGKQILPIGKKIDE